MFDKILIANRGEIAVRVMKTARRLGIRTVAVYSQADAGAMHVELADEAVCIGPAPAAQSYLRGDVILQAARSSGAQAVHPGYGFLSENAGFAAACEQAGVVFIGPPIAAIHAMGSKAESKRLMESAGVPLVPGYHGKAQDPDTLRSAAQRIGFPVLVKASAGGGGKGMRIVTSASELDDAVAGARRESMAAFGDDSLLLEKYLLRPRHVEIQVFADQHGHCLYIFDRDCSIQRRHQKVIEEAPAPALDDAVRARMGEAAVAAARSVNYVGAGTVEFLYENGEFYFIEMNTRLQVEHPVTEMITGLDLVEWQLRVAAGEALPLTQAQLRRKGHAFEARIYAEDPQRGFLPAIGRLDHLQPPAEDGHVRVDTGVRSADEVSIHYDPMIAKLIVWDEDRLAALRRFKRALSDYEVAGVTTNISLLAAIAGHDAFASQQIDTGFIERHREALIPSPRPVPDEGLVLAALAILRREDAHTRQLASADPHSPWNTLGGWQLNADSSRALYIKDDGVLREVTVHFSRNDYEIEVPGGRRIRVAQLTLAGGILRAELDGVRVSARVVFLGRQLTLISAGHTWRLEIDDALEREAKQDSGSGRLTAPMPGAVVSILVKEGDRVVRDQPLIVLEAMKMEHTIKASAAGRVVKVHFAVGQQVNDGAQLLTIEAEEV
jgi:3-methylcrotonyl-CoA carboxylase alpha subunit